MTLPLAQRLLAHTRPNASVFVMLIGFGFQLSEHLLGNLANLENEHGFSINSTQRILHTMARAQGLELETATSVMASTAETRAMNTLRTAMRARQSIILQRPNTSAIGRCEFISEALGRNYCLIALVSPIGNHLQDPDQQEGFKEIIHLESRHPALQPQA